MGPETQAFLQNCWYVAAWDHELIDGKLLARTILEKPVVLYRGDSGRVVALDNRCCHRGARLSNGRREGDDVRCMYHGLKFDPSGKCIQIPGQDNIPPKLGVRSYPVLERDHLIWLWTGDAAKAGRVDRRNIARMYVPGIFFMETLFSPAGTGAQKGNVQAAKQYRNCQFFTPETRRSTHFFWDYLHDYDLQDPSIALSLNKSMIEGFLEDKFIIEGQQQVLDADPNFKMNAIVADAPLAHFRRTLGRLIDAEHQALQPAAA